MSEENKNQEELLRKREARRKRRQRNQIMAYSAVLALILLLAGGTLFVINSLSKAPKEPNDGKNVAQSTPTQSEESTEVSEPDTEEFSSEPEEISSEPEETEPPVVELTYEEKLDQIVNAAIEVMPIEDKVAGLFMLTPEGLTGVKQVTKAGDSTKEALSKYAVGGLLYRTQNIKNKDSFKTMLENTILFSKYPVFLSVEEETGDANQIFKKGIGTKTDSAKALAATGDPQKAFEAGTAIGTYLKELGITMDLAPVADLTSVEKSVVENRSFGSDLDVAYAFTTSVMAGLKEQGITPCVKHFPGLGSVKTDTDKGVVVSERTEEEFWANEILLYQRLINDGGANVIMVSNMAAPSLAGDNTPCSLSEQVVTGILRQKLEYRGLIITDALDEKAVSEYYSSEQAAIMALKAGCDMIMCPENFEEAYNGVLKAVQDGTISEERINDALRRIYRIKCADRVER